MSSSHVLYSGTNLDRSCLTDNTVDWNKRTAVLEIPKLQYNINNR